MSRRATPLPSIFWTDGAPTLYEIGAELHRFIRSYIGQPPKYLHVILSACVPL